MVAANRTTKIMSGQPKLAPFCRPRKTLMIKSMTKKIRIGGFHLGIWCPAVVS